MWMVEFCYTMLAVTANFGTEISTLHVPLGLIQRCFDMPADMAMAFCQPCHTDLPLSLDDRQNFSSPLSPGSSRHHARRSSD